MKLILIIHLYWIFSTLKALTKAQWQDGNGGTESNILLGKRQLGAIGLGNGGGAGFGNMMANGFGGLGAMGGNFPAAAAAAAAMANPQAAAGLLGAAGGFGANPFAMGATAPDMGTMQGMGAGPFAGAAMMGAAAANPLMAALAQGLNAQPLMNGFGGGGMDGLQQLQALRFANPPMAANPLAAMLPAAMATQGFGAGGLGMNFMNGAGMGAMNGFGMNMANGGMGAGMGNGLGAGMGAGMGAGLGTGMGNGMGAGMGGFGGGLGNGMGSQFLKHHKRWSKSEEGQNDSSKIPFSSVIDALKLASKTSEDDEIDSQEATSCGGCIPLDLRKITGSWTQIYGNPDSLRVIYTSLSALQPASESEDRSEMAQPAEREVSKNDTSVQPGCVGFHFERPFPRRVSDAILGEAPVNVHFRDDQSYKPYQVSGMVQQSLIPNQSEVRLRISKVDIPICLIKGGGPTPNGDYDYAIFMETRGTHRCKALHVLARNSDTFFHSYSSDVTEFLQQKVRSGEAHTVKIMPNPEQCEPRQQQNQWQLQQEKDGSR